MPTRKKMCSETLRHRGAFDFYYLLGENRSLQAVASKFRTSKQTVGNWSASFNWRKRVLQRDRSNAQALEARSDINIQESKAGILKMLYAKIHAWDETFFGKSVTPEMRKKKIGEFSAFDICAFTRLVFSLGSNEKFPAETREDTRSLDQLTDLELETIILTGQGKVRPGHFKYLSDAELDEVRSLFEEIRPLSKRVDELTKVAVCAAVKAKKMAAGKREVGLVQ